MSHTITRPKHNITTPTGLYEANFHRMMRLFPELGDLGVKETLTLPETMILITVLEQYKYTTLVSLKQSLQNKTESSKEGSIGEETTRHPHLLSIDMDLRICHDASLVEVIAYQGQNPIHSALSYPNQHMLQLDEKRQLNLFLKDVLENALKIKCHAHNSLSPC